MKQFDYVVIGSGCSGAMAAQTLVEAGKKVTMLDVGVTRDPEAVNIPNKDFLHLRKTDKRQGSYLIGKHAEGVMWGDVGKGEQITPPRKHITKLVDELIPVDSTSFSPLESLAYGGLGAGWGLQCWEYSEFDIQKAGLPYGDMVRAYDIVGDRIGISATKDAAARYTIAQLKKYQPSPKMDRNHRYIWGKYLARQSHFENKGFIMGRTPLALITKDHDGRKGYAYRDMDFYSDNGRSAWRPWVTVDKLKEKPNFEYVGGYLLVSFSENAKGIELHCLKTEDDSRHTFRCRRLILATGALGSARVVLRSLAKKGARVPLLCNPYHYVPCIQPALMGKAVEPRKLGFTQISLFLDEAHDNRDVSVASLYSYQSLMLFRIIRHMPLNFRDSRLIMQYLMSGLVIMGVHHPDAPSANKYLQLIESSKTPTGDMLKAVYQVKKDEAREYERREKKYLQAMRQMRTYGLKRIDPGFGASIHYAGTLPFSTVKKDLSLSPDGRLHGTKHVYVADSSGFNYLPAKGLTFSILANAHLVAENVLRDET